MQIQLIDSSFSLSSALPHCVIAVLCGGGGGGGGGRHLRLKARMENASERATKHAANIFYRSRCSWRTKTDNRARQCRLLMPMCGLIVFCILGPDCCQ